MAADGHAGARRKPIVTPVPIGAPAGERAVARSAAKPTPADLGVDLSTLDWQRSGAGPGSFEVAFVAGLRGEGSGPVAGSSRPGVIGAGHGSARHDSAGQRGQNGTGQNGTGQDAADHGKADWVLLRVADDPAGRVLVYDRNEWACFLDGAEHGEFDWPEGLTRPAVA